MFGKLQSERSSTPEGARPVRWARRLTTACSAVVALVASGLVPADASVYRDSALQQPAQKSIKERVEAVRDRVGGEPLESLGIDEGNRRLAQWYNWDNWQNGWDNYWPNY